MKKVTSLYGGPTGEKVQNENVIETIEELMQEAKSGEISGIAVAFINHKNLASYSFGGHLGAFGLLGAIEKLRHKINIINDDEQ